GVRLRGQFGTINLDKLTSVTSSFALHQRWGTTSGPATYGSLGIVRQMGWGSMNLNYDYAADDSLASTLAGGKHRLSMEGNYEVGRMSVNLFASKSLDADWSSYYGDLSYQLSGLYRVSAAYTLDKYLADTSLDYNFMLSYRLGVRELGLTWSRKTRRVGLEILGARF
ncbi:MAG: hypothetical protein QOJ65_2304, partial [Fimbriimonadaceae bacterium]|nr:hypothetical protein [Fimbriimonadaceae bacterium]